MSRQQRREDERELKKREAKWKTMTPAQQCASMVRVVYAMAAQICKDWKTDAISLVTLYELTNKIKIDINALANAPEDDLKSAEGYNNVVAMMYLNWEDAAKERGSEFVPLAVFKIILAVLIVLSIIIGGLSFVFIRYGWEGVLFAFIGMCITSIIVAGLGWLLFSSIN